MIGAHEARHRLVRELADGFARFDLLPTPTTRPAAFPAEGPMPRSTAGRDTDHWGALGLTYPFDLSGHPAGGLGAGRTGRRHPRGTSDRRPPPPGRAGPRRGRRLRTGMSWPLLAPLGR
ncbi:hypothetical protein [Streptomyces odontomachi]|uniref:hypothetical protein n=1 Tax=Streptomyces odontomachi TaxID=2944940 RepID=UPI00210A98A3|nr:hypothetical protein [Streptomyces sp. ODS25]